MCESDIDKRWEKFSDIGWVMEATDIALCLDRLDVKMTKREGLNWEGYCPDHFLYKGCEPSDPKWYINLATGETFCQTEGRGSNLVFTTARLLRENRTGTTISIADCESAVRFLIGKDCSESEIAFLRNQRLLKNLTFSSKPKKEIIKTWRDEVEILMKNGYLSPRAISYFIQPPDKPATNISLETIKFFGIYERTSGQYVNRVIVPIIMNQEIQGFVAIDILGKKEWLLRHPTLDEGKYKKTLYPSQETGFFRKNVLFGYDNCEKGADFIILTEGAREVMKLWQEGYKNSLAILGAYMSDEQFLLLTKLAPKKVVLMFDGDTAGRKIAETVKEKIQDLFPVQIISLPEGVDPKQLEKQDFDRLIFC